MPFCSQCGESLSQDDAYCDSCGAPADDGQATSAVTSHTGTPTSGAVPAPVLDDAPGQQPAASRTRWVWVAAVAVLILAAGGIVATVLMTSKKNASPTAFVRVSASPSSQATASGTTQSPLPTATTMVTATPSASATPASALAHDSPTAPFWAAFFFASYSWDSAQAQARKARDMGLTDVLVLLTTEYANLGRPGETIWSCCVGPLGTRAEAASEKADLRTAGWTDAYVKLAQ